jgi:hypothetical protein
MVDWPPKNKVWNHSDMSFHKTLLMLLGACFLAGCQSGNKNSAYELYKVPKGGYPVTVEASGSKQVDALVRQLVSRRPAPFPSGDSDTPSAVANYSTPEVETALERLKRLGPAIFPMLVKHIGDDRYSYSFVVAAWINGTVGESVVEVLDDGHGMHSGYKVRDTPSGTGGGYLFFREYLDARGVEAWAEWAKNKTRLEIQMDFIDWCIGKENERGYVDEAQKEHVLATYEAARAQVKVEYSGPGGTAHNGKRTRSGN